jgi:predicted  nucleic acid-binding Zn-ribbon protein
VTLIVDTLRFSKLLQDKGHFSAAQADTLAETIGTIGTENLATKTDVAELRVTISELRSEIKGDIASLRTEIADLRSELKAEIADLRSELKAEIADLRVEFKAEIGALRSELQKWIIGAIGVQTLVIVGLILTVARSKS